MGLNAGCWARLASLGVACALLARASSARADEVSASGKGIVGGALLGGEAITVGEAALGVKSGWLYLAGGVAGVAGGAYLGHLVEDSGSSKTSAYLLTGGLVLLIPTTVAILQASSYSPPDEYTEDRVTPTSPVSEPPQPGLEPNPATVPAPSTPSTVPAAPAPSGMPPVPSSRAPQAERTLALHYHWSSPKLAAAMPQVGERNEGLCWALPTVEVRPLYTPLERAQYGLPAGEEVRVALSASF